MATELTEEQIGRMAARVADAQELILRLAAQFDGNWRITVPPHVTDSDFVLRRVCEDVERLLVERRQMQVEIAELKQALTGRTVSCAGCARLSELEPLAAVGQAAIRLYECQCEFVGHEGCCSEWRDMLDGLIAAYKDGYEARAIASGQNDPMEAKPCDK